MKSESTEMRETPQETGTGKKLKGKSHSLVNDEIDKWGFITLQNFHTQHRKLCEGQRRHTECEEIFAALHLVGEFISTLKVNTTPVLLECLPSRKQMLSVGAEISTAIQKPL